MHEIKLSNSDQIVFVDDEDYAALSHWSWHLNKDGYPARTRKVKRGGKPGWEVVCLHHMVIGKPPKGFLIDHINRNPLDNRRSNLRIATPSQNHMNGYRKTKSGYKGVSKTNGMKTWTIRVQGLDGVRRQIGGFTSKDEAAMAYNELALKHQGEFAYLNKIPPNMIPTTPWEEEFDEHFADWTLYKPGSFAGLKVKTFIRSLLLEMKKELEVLRKDDNILSVKGKQSFQSDLNHEFNEGLDAAIAVVEGVDNRI